MGGKNLKRGGDSNECDEIRDHGMYQNQNQNIYLVNSTVEPLTNDHPHQRPSLSYDHISCDGQWFLFVYESLTSDHPSYTTTPMWFWGWSYKRGSTVTVHLHKESETNQDQERNKTGGHHLTQAAHGNIGEHIWKVKLGYQGREDKGRIYLQSPLCWWHITMHRNTSRTTADATRAIRWN